MNFAVYVHDYDEHPTLKDYPITLPTYASTDIILKKTIKKRKSPPPDSCEHTNNTKNIFSRKIYS